MPALAAIEELRRFPAPGPEPLGLAFDGSTLWIASREAHRLYTVDSANGTVGREVAAPGAPFGITARNGQLRVIVGFGDDDDDRYIYRFVPGDGFGETRITCPRLSGVHLAFHDDLLCLSQAHDRRILWLDDRGAIVRSVSLGRVPVGMTVVDGIFYLITGDRDFKNLELTALDATGETPTITALARIPFVARGLAFDGARFWTGDRATNEIVAFAMPRSWIARPRMNSAARLEPSRS